MNTVGDQWVQDMVLLLGPVWSVLSGWMYLLAYLVVGWLIATWAAYRDPYIWEVDALKIGLFYPVYGLGYAIWYVVFVPCLWIYDSPVKVGKYLRKRNRQ